MRVVCVCVVEQGTRLFARHTLLRQRRQTHAYLSQMYIVIALATCSNRKNADMRMFLSCANGDMYVCLDNGHEPVSRSPLRQFKQF